MANRKKKPSALNRKGTFTQKARKKGISSASLQANVEKDPDKYDDETKKQAKLRAKLVQLKKRQKSNGGKEKE